MQTTLNPGGSGLRNFFRNPLKSLANQGKLDLLSTQDFMLSGDFDSATTGEQVVILDKLLTEVRQNSNSKFDKEVVLLGECLSNSS